MAAPGRAPGRLRDRRTFEELRRAGRRAQVGRIGVVFAETSSSQAVFGYTISRRHGSAVVRNRLRRRLRAVAAEAAATLPGGAYLVRPAPGAAGLEFEELRRQMMQALGEATSGGTPGTV